MMITFRFLISILNKSKRGVWKLCLWIIFCGFANLFYDRRTWCQCIYTNDCIISITYLKARVKFIVLNSFKRLLSAKSISCHFDIKIMKKKIYTDESCILICKIRFNCMYISPAPAFYFASACMFSRLNLHVISE